ncbi:MAG TPA: adenylate/guanylate cyclase domain-containing protein [Solirubrobacteraceae bacterium]|nr:adenylate/guanylate cyclase domain-containing protein [Solirubrobacteraceae bacterium]
MAQAAAVCPSCQAPNPQGAAFCMACGTALTANCPSCGTPAPAGARFCISCGTALGGAPASAAPQPAATSEERRTVTVLFADLSGYTSVAERLDHETVKMLIERCLNRFAEEVERFGGRVDKFIGDNVMAVFGAPVAHEDDPERAVRAAFGMHAAMAELNSDIAAQFGFDLALRVGVNTGEVLAGRVGDSYTVLGDAVNVAARLQSAAPLGGTLVGERTQRLTAKVVSYRELEPLELKGKAERVSAWEALAVGSLEQEPAPATRLTAPLIGRDEELARLEGLLERVAREHAPHLVTIVGQAGVGKSRLLAELERTLGEDGTQSRLLRGRCLAFGQGVVYWPLIEMIRSECGIAEGDDPATVRERLNERLLPLLSAHEEADQAERRIAPIARLLGAADSSREPVADKQEQQDARESFFGAVRVVIEALAAQEALVLAWEDIHWADEGTLDLIDYLSRWLRAPVLQVCLARDELLGRRPGWSTMRRTATVTFLEPLAPEDAQALIRELLRASGAISEQESALAERCGGNPLFAEEMVQRISEEGSATTTAELPDTVQGLLAARLDALEPFERQLVSHAAILGRTFWESALEPVAAVAGGELSAALASLREKDILLPGESRDAGGERELAFKHVLIRDVAYEMLPKAVRARKHAEVGEFIQQRLGARGEGTVALVAEHYSRAAAFAAEAHLPAAEADQLRGLALRYREAAGDAAASLYSNREALFHYEAATALLDGEIDTAERIAEKSGDVALRLGRVDPAIELWEGCLEYHAERGELQHVAELHRKIGAALAHKGERKSAIEHHQQGINLIKDEEPSLTLVRLYEEAAWLYMQVGDNMLAIYASEKALRLAESLGEARAASRAHGIFGRVFGRIGDAAKARENLERAVELARQSDEEETVLALLALGHNLEHSEGDYAGAGARYREALALAERIDELPAQIELLSALAQLAFYRGDWDEVRSASDASARLAEREGLVGKLCLPNIMRGRLRWREGDWDASESLLSSARELADRIGWSEVTFSALMALAATQRDRGALDRAQGTLGEALAVCERAGLVPQSVQAHAARTLIAILAERPAEAREAATAAEEASKRVHDPAGAAAAQEAVGMIEPMPEALERLQAARAEWLRLGRPLEVARCEMLMGRRMRDDRNGGAAADALRDAASMYDQLGVAHLAARARELAAS